MLILPADPNRISVTVESAFLACLIADNRETLTSETTAQHAFAVDQIILTGYTGPLYGRTKSFLPHATLAGIITVHATSKGNRR